MPKTKKLELSGVFTALITPFKTDGEVDWEDVEKLIDAQIAAGVDGLVPIGTTGESPTLTSEEKDKIIKMCVVKAKAAGGKIKVIAGTGSNNTASTVAATKKAKDLGVDCVLIVNPYYNKPSQNGLYNHIKSVDAIGVPIMLYNIPGRSGINMAPSTIARIYNDCENVVAVKEATGSLEQAIEIAALCDITILSGDDAMTLPLMSIGGKGIVSVTSNFKPKLMLEMVKGGEVGLSNLKKNYKLIKNMFLETNPVPVKFAMYKTGMIKTPTVRQPLAELTDESAATVTKVLTEYKFL